MSTDPVAKRQAFPTIAIAMPAYNAGPWIADTIRTILAQTSPPNQIIVVDDGSTDGTAGIARAFGSAITVVEQENAGPPAAYNSAFDLADTDYVAMCPADDLWHPNKLEWQAATLQADPSIDVSFGRAEFFGLQEGDHPHPRKGGQQEPDEFLRAMYEADLIPAPTAVVRRDLHARLGRFDQELPSEDYEFWLRALCEGAKFHYDPRVMVRLRQHGGNVSSRGLEIWKMNLQLREAYADAVADPSLARREIARAYRQIARCEFGLDSTDAAHDAYAASWRTRPTFEAAVGMTLLRVPAVAGRVRALYRRLRPQRV